MKLHGSLVSRLEAAMQSARRLEKQRIYAGTLDYWAKLLVEAHHSLGKATGPDDTHVRKIIAELEEVLLTRKLTSGRLQRLGGSLFLR